ncbi:MAG: phosphotransferase [Alphaproteobacteria bacterium]|nr:phosphotransferase [Alphaproteobacteria bacterium]
MSTQIEIDAALVRRLLAAQHPDLAGLPIRKTDAGIDNAMFRLGDDLAVRMPMRPEAATLIEHEQAWLPALAPALPVAVPAPLRVGTPDAGYPWRWSIVPWLDGEPADLAPLGVDAALSLAAFLRALHQPTPPEAPRNPHRGLWLGEREPGVAACLDRIDGHIGGLAAAVRTTWANALAADKPSASVWLHGDMHARNVLSHSGRISAIIDWGDMCSGDAATDLSSIWMLLPDAASRAEAIGLYTPDAALLARARGWAVLFGAILVDMGLSGMPRYEEMGRKTLRALAEDG